MERHLSSIFSAMTEHQNLRFGISVPTLIFVTPPGERRMCQGRAGLFALSTGAPTGKFSTLQAKPFPRNKHPCRSFDMGYFCNFKINRLRKLSLTGNSTMSSNAKNMCIHKRKWSPSWLLIDFGLDVHF